MWNSARWVATRALLAGGLASLGVGCIDDPRPAREDGEGDAGRAADTGLAGDIGRAGDIGPGVEDLAPPEGGTRPPLDLGTDDLGTDDLGTEPGACQGEGLWALDNGAGTRVVVVVDGAGDASVVAYEPPAATCAGEVGRPGAGAVAATFDADTCTLSVRAQVSWCAEEAGGFDLCRRIEAEADLRTGAVAGQVWRAQCIGGEGGPEGEWSARRLDDCPFRTSVEDFPEPPARPEVPSEDVVEAVGAATVRSVTARARPDGPLRVAVQLDAEGEPGAEPDRSVAGRVFQLNLPAPLAVSEGDRVWIDVSAYLPSIPVRAVALVLHAPSATGAPSALDPILYAAVQGDGRLHPGQPLARAGLGLAPVPACSRSTACQSEATIWAAGWVSDSDGPQPRSPASPAAAPGQAVWLPPVPRPGADPQSDLLLRTQRGITGVSDLCSGNPDTVLDAEILWWPRPR